MLIRMKFRAEKLERRNVFFFSEFPLALLTCRKKMLWTYRIWEELKTTGSSQSPFYNFTIFLLIFDRRIILEKRWAGTYRELIENSCLLFWAKPIDVFPPYLKMTMFLWFSFYVCSLPNQSAFSFASLWLRKETAIPDS